MSRHPFTRLRDHRLALVACVLILALPASPLETALPTPEQPTHGARPEHERGKLDPCEQLADVPGHANGLHRRCEILGGGSGVARADFDCDGIGDLAIGIPFENLEDAPNAGAVHVIYGSSVNGLDPTESAFSPGDEVWNQDSPGVAGAPEDGDHFGAALAAGDFNGDACSDLAIGAPDENRDDFPDEGLVQILEGSPDGLVAAESWNAEELGRGKCIGCRFGAALAWGDFDGDGFGDLAIGAPRYEVSLTVVTQNTTVVTGAGSVRILYGSDDGLQVVGNQLLHQSPVYDVLESTAFDLGDFAETDDLLGTALAAGDHDGDGFDDLVIGVPSEDTSLFAPDAGIVYVAFGSEDGIEFAGPYQQGVANLGGLMSSPGASESGDQYGRRLAMGDFDGDGDDEIVVGVPYENVGSTTNAGAVFVLAFGAGGDQGWDQNLIPGTLAEASDQFGWALAAGDFNGDGMKDLAIGVPYEDLGDVVFLSGVPISGLINTGLVHVLYGSGNGLTTSNDDIWHQDTMGVPGDAETGDAFGFALSAWNFGKGSQADLAIGAPYEDVGSITNAGVVTVLYGSSSGLITTGAQVWHQNVGEMKDQASTEDLFGYALY